MGLEITRAGKDYITVKDPETSKRYRLRGKLYEREFRPEFQATTKTNDREGVNSTINSFELLAVRERIKSNYQYRYQYHQKRYGASKPSSELDAGQVLAHPSRFGVEPLSGHLQRQLGSNAILIESDNRETGDVRLSGRENQFSGSGVETATKYSEQNTGVNRGDSDRSNRQRDISDSSDPLDPDPWLAMSRKTLPEIGALKDTATHIDYERTRKTIDGEFKQASTAVQTGYDESVPQIQRGHESALCAERAASYSSDGLEQTGEGLERANRFLEFIQQQTDLNLSRIRVALKKRRERELERFKTEINLVAYATSQGYQYLKRESSRSSAVLRHNSGDKIIVATDTENRGIYFSVGDDSDNGTIIDFVQNRSNLNLGGVRKELRSWLANGELPMVMNIAKPEPAGRDTIDECLQRQKHLNQSSPQPTELQKPKQKKQRQLEL